MEHQQQDLSQLRFAAAKQDNEVTKPAIRRREADLNLNVVYGRGASANEDGRERLKRHRSEVAGRVVVPDKWSQEEMLKDWLDFASFDALLAPKGFDLARAALVAERRQANKDAMESTNNSKTYLGLHYTATRCI